MPIPVPAARPPAPTVPAAAPGDIGEIFGQPGRKNWSPAEIVQKTGQLGGVGGALIILQDGLLVAAQLPPGLSSETIAAFIPQMYGRMTQYCKELKFGEPRKLTFVIENLPLKIYRGAGLYFTILGRAGETLPDGHLDVIAAQLGSASK
jgi:predicted regulator of Ras-like GTPase activity (Roadblock/LC7/MglB family)